MPKLRLKVKHIVLLLLIGILIWWGQSFIVSQMVFNKGISYLEDGNKEEGIAYLRKYTQEFPANSKVLSAFEKVLAEITHTNNYSIFIAHGRSGGGIQKLAELEKLEQLNKDFKELKKYHQEEELSGLQIKLAGINYQANNINKTRQLLQDLISKKNNSEASEIAAQLLTLLHLELGEIKQAENLLDNINFKSEKLEKARYWIDLMKANVDKSFEDKILQLESSPLFQSKYYQYYQRNSWAEKYIKSDIIKRIYKNKNGKKANVKGYVQKGDQPLVNTIIMLQKKESIDSYSYHSGDIDHTADYLTVTNEKGYYEIKDVEPGYYYVGIGIAYQRVSEYLLDYPEDIAVEEGKIIERDIQFKPGIEIVKAPEQREIEEYISFNLKWDPYPGASYYKVYLGISDEVSTSYPLRGDKIFATETTVQLTPGVFDHQGISFDSEGISPGCIIGYERIPCKVVYTIHAYNDEGESISRVIDPDKEYSFKWTGKDELNRGDKLLLERKYKEAIAVYEEMISKDNKNEHVFKVLGKLYYNGYKHEGMELVGQDYEKARKYLTAAYQLGKDNNLLHYLESLSVRVGDWKAAEKYNEKRIQSDPDNGWLLFFKGQLQLYQGNLSVAEEYLIKGIQDIGTRQEYLMITYLLQGKKEDALTIYNRYPDKYASGYNYDYTELLKKSYKVLNWDELRDFFEMVNSGQLKKAVEALSPDSETGKFYHALSLVLKPKSWMKEDFYQAYQSQQNPVLKEFIRVIGKKVINSAFPERIK